MIYSDYTFPYNKYKGINFEQIAEEKYKDAEGEITNTIEYSQSLGMYRVTRFLNNHWDGDLVFDEFRPPVEGFNLLAKLGYLREEHTDLVSIDEVINIVAEWLLDSRLIDEVDY